jgi:Kef-type K+ transport system membrane component KefB
MRAVSVFKVLVTVVAGMGAMGLGLALVGLYGLVAYAASRRTREIGVRMAIGAERATVVRLVLRQGVELALVGLAIGLVTSVAAGRLMAAAFPTGGNPRDLMAQLLVIPIVLAVTSPPTFRRSRHRASIRSRRCARNSVSRSQGLRRIHARRLVSRVSTDLVGWHPIPAVKK